MEGRHIEAVHNDFGELDDKRAWPFIMLHLFFGELTDSGIKRATAMSYGKDPFVGDPLF